MKVLYPRTNFAYNLLLAQVFACSELVKTRGPWATQPPFLYNEPVQTNPSLQNIALRVPGDVRDSRTEHDILKKVNDTLREAGYHESELFKLGTKGQYHWYRSRMALTPMLAKMLFA